MEFSNNSGIPFSSRKEYSALEPRSQIINAAKNWVEFLKKISHKANLSISEDKQLIQPEVFEAFQLYFTRAKEKASDEKAKNMIESQLASLCLNPLLASRHFMFEESSISIKNWSQINRAIDSELANNFRKITFVRETERSQRVDFAMRTCYGPEINSNENLTKLISYESNEILNYQIPHWRFNPLAIIAHFDLKRVNESPEDHIAQGLYYCESVLRTTPSRNICYCAISNIIEVIFVAVVYKDNAYHQFHSLIFKKTCVDNLASFFATFPKYLGKVDIDLPLDIMSVNKVLGRGSSSWVISCSLISDENKTIALKISPSSNSIIVERKILSYLKDHIDNSYFRNIPSVDEKTQSNLTYPEFMTVFDQVYLPLTESFIKKRLFKLWDVLSAVHKIGIVHCDVRLPNCRLDDLKNIVLLDWSSSRPYREISELNEINDKLQFATMITASDRVLQSMKDNNNNFKCDPKDEGVSMIYFALQWCFRKNKNIQEASLNVELTKSNREGFWKSLHCTIEIKKKAEDICQIIEKILNIQENEYDLYQETLTGFVKSAIESVLELRDLYEAYLKTLIEL